MNPYLVSALIVYLALSGAPLFVVLGGIAVALLVSGGLPLSTVASEVYRMAQMPTLVAIPLFTFAGYVVSESRAPQRLIRFSRTLLGWMPGGTAIVGLLCFSVFTALTGASGVTIIALGGLMLPLLLADGYGRRFSLGFVTAAGSFGLLLPPSLPVILYGMFSETSIDKLFIAGVLPMGLMILMFSAYSVWALRRGGLGRRRAFSRKKLWAASRRVVWELPLPALLIFGMYSGLFTINELATLTAAYVLVVEVFVTRELRLRRDLFRVVLNSMLMVGSILMILGCALGLTNYLIDAQIPMKILDWIRAHAFTDKYMFLMGLNVFLLVVGCLIDIFSAIIIIVPLIVPIAHELGVDPVHLGIVFLINLQIGYITPPVGMSLFIASTRLDAPILQLYRASFPFLLIMLACLVIITYFPWLSTALLGL